MVGSGEKLDTDPWITQPGRGLCREPFFSGAVDLFKSVSECAKGCHVDWRGKHMCHVDQVFPYRVYIDSNRRDSRI
jgi:hypothetical protein